MPYLVQPPAHSIDACNPLFTYTLANPTPAEFSTLKDLQEWGWDISVRFRDDAEYIDAVKETERAIKRRRRRTSMVFGDMIGDGPRPSLQELWEREMTARFARGLYKVEEEVDEAKSCRRKEKQQQQRQQQQSFPEGITKIPWPHQESDDEDKRRNHDEQMTEKPRQINTATNRASPCQPRVKVHWAAHQQSTTNPVYHALPRKTK